MKISIRTCPSVPGPTVGRFAAHRVRTATGRFSQRLRDVEVDVSRESPREGGRYVCRVQGTLARGGTVIVKRDDKDVRGAVAGTVERFRRSLVRTLDRREL